MPARWGRTEPARAPTPRAASPLSTGPGSSPRLSLPSTSCLSVLLGTNLTGDTTGLLRLRVAFPRAQAPPQPWAGLGAERTAAVDSAPLPRPCTPQPGRVLLVCGALPAFNAHVRGPRGNAARGENTLRCGHVIAKSQGDGRGDVPRGARGSERGPDSRAAPGDVGPPPCPRRLAPPRQEGWKDKSHQWRRGLCCLSL